MAASRWRDTPPVPCPDCSASFPSIRAMRAHRRETHDPRPGQRPTAAR
jgi:hypothetical protein